MPDRPNLVFIMSDQQRYDSMACYGNDWLKVPNLNALAAQSFVFRNAYVTQPLCTPARASIMTGLYPHTAGAMVNVRPSAGAMVKPLLPRETDTIAEMVSADRLCGYMGKWHLGDDVIPQHGFTVWVSTEDHYRRNYTRKQYLRKFSDLHQVYLDHGYTPDIDYEGAGTMTFSVDIRSRMPEELQMASFLGDRAADFIEKNKERPFVLYVSAIEPHSPYEGPFQDFYDPSTIPVGPAFLKRPDGASLLNRARADYFMSFMLDGADQKSDPFMMSSVGAAREDVTTELGWRTLRAHYFANITLVDRMVGKIISALDRAGIAENTIVVFTSEHGDMMGDHGSLEKRAMYEESARVPLLIRVPWLADGQREIGGSVGHIDLVPTLLDLLGEAIPSQLQGKSLAPVLRGEDTLEKNDVFIEWNGRSPKFADWHIASPEIMRLIALPWRSVVTPDRWKLNLCAGDQCELFDLNNDPFEITNLFDDPAQKDRIRDMAARIRSWQADTGDSAPLPSC